MFYSVFIHIRANTLTHPLISIIVPHYNNPDGIKVLLKSIPSDPRIEIIIVDDHSESESLSLIHEAAAECRGHHLSIFTQNTKGFAGGARNRGIESAAGYWILFSDSDDVLLLTIETIDFVERISKEASLVDLVYFGVTDNIPFPQKGRRVKHLTELVETNDTKGLRYSHTVPWGKFIRRDLIVANQIIFDLLPASNDVIFSLKVGHAANEILVIDDICYQWNVRPGSITNTISRENLLAKLDVVLRANKFLKACDASRYRQSALYILYRLFRLSILDGLLQSIYFVLRGGNILVGATKIFQFRDIIKRRDGT